MLVGLFNAVNVESVPLNFTHLCIRRRFAASLESRSVGLEDRDALRVLQNAFKLDDPELVRRFYAHWFALDASVRDLFPPDMGAQRAAFGQALHWVYGELVAQRAEEPVAFLAQLGRDHRKYGVLPTQYDTLRRALYTTLRDYLGHPSRGAWTDAVDEAAGQSLNLIIGVMSGAADADDAPAWWDGTVVEHIRVSRDLAVARLQLDRPLHYYPGQYVNVHVPQCPRRWRYLSQPFRPTRTGGSSFTSGWFPVAWSATPSWVKLGPVTGGDCPVRTEPSGGPRRRRRAHGRR